MNKKLDVTMAAVFLAFVAQAQDGDGTVSISGEPKQWHNVTLTLDGPFAREIDTDPNPFTDYRFDVRFVHESGSPDYTVPGYFAADGDAANSSAAEGNQWRAHLSPDKTGVWTYEVTFQRGDNVALYYKSEARDLPFDGAKGAFEISSTDKEGRDFRSSGRLEYVGERYLRFAGSGDYFLKAGPDAPETTLAYTDFDGTEPGRKRDQRTGEAAFTQTLKTWEPHIQDWNQGDPTWGEGLGKGLIGGLNYLAGKGVNSFSFLPYNAGGDGDNVWPFIARDAKLHYDVSKLAQWGVVFEHATAQGLHLHFKLQENEMDDHRVGHERNERVVPEALDGGKTGVERRLYFREMIARFSHNLALNWNLGEENTQSTEEIIEMAQFIQGVDPYGHNIVVHTFPNQQDEVYRPLLGSSSGLTGASLQNSWEHAHRRTLQWVNESKASGFQWVVANDEQGPASLGVPPDAGYEGHSGVAQMEKRGYTADDVRKRTLWGCLMAGGAGVEYYFGYQLPQNDLITEDWRSRDRSWDYCRIALEFFGDHEIPFWRMENHNALVGNDANTNQIYCFAEPGELYLVFLPEGGVQSLDLSDANGAFGIQWFNPREGGGLTAGSVARVQAGGSVSLGMPPSDGKDDWLAVVRRVSR